MKSSLTGAFVSGGDPSGWTSEPVTAIKVRRCTTIEDGFTLTAEVEEGSQVRLEMTRDAALNLRDYLEEALGDCQHRAETRAQEILVER